MDVDPEVPAWAGASELEELARRRISTAAAVYLSGGAGESRTLQANVAAFTRYALVPRVLRDTSALDTSVEVLGQRWATPLWVAPVGMQRSVHPAGENATAAAAAAAGFGYVLSCGSSLTLEEVAPAAPSTRLFQLYKVSDDSSVLADLARRAADAGYRGLCLTVDSPVHGWRRDAVRNAGSTRLPNQQMANLVPYADRLSAAVAANAGASNGAAQARPFEPPPHFPTVWQDVRKLRELTDLPILLKGILDPEDATTALDCGAQGVIVSNHGGRQLDHAIATLEALPAVAAAVGERGVVLFDGGVRTASDAVIALALGAHAVGLGRAPMWALGAGGQAGVETFLTAFRTDLARVMRLAGAAAVDELNPAFVYDRQAGVRCVRGAAAGVAP